MSARVSSCWLWLLPSVLLDLGEPPMMVDLVEAEAELESAAALARTTSYMGGQLWTSPALTVVLVCVEWWGEWWGCRRVRLLVRVDITGLGKLVGQLHINLC